MSQKWAVLEGGSGSTNHNQLTTASTEPSLSHDSQSGYRSFMPSEWPIWKDLIGWRVPISQCCPPLRHELQILRPTWTASAKHSHSGKGKWLLLLSLCCCYVVDFDKDFYTLRIVPSVLGVCALPYIFVRCLVFAFGSFREFYVVRCVMSSICRGFAKSRPRLLVCALASCVR